MAAPRGDHGAGTLRGYRTRVRDRGSRADNSAPSRGRPALGLRTCPNAGCSTRPSCSRRSPTTRWTELARAVRHPRARTQRRPVPAGRPVDRAVRRRATGRIAIATQSADGRESVVAVLEDGRSVRRAAACSTTRRARPTPARSSSSDGRRARVRAGPRSVYEARPGAAVGHRAPARRAACAPPTRRSPTRCSSTCPAARPSGCSSWPATPTSSRSRSPRRSWPAMVGASRERVNKALALFIRLGWIEVAGPQPLPASSTARRSRTAPRSSARHAQSARRNAERARARRRRRRRVGARAGRGRARSRGRRRGRRRPRSRAGRPTPSRSASMSAGGVYGSTPPKIASVGHTSARGVERLALPGPRQSSGDADHPVERHRPVEAPGGRRLERVHAAHAEADHRDVARRRRATTR